MILRIVAWNVQGKAGGTKAAVDFVTKGIVDRRTNPKLKPEGSTNPATVDLAIILEPWERNGELPAPRGSTVTCYDLVRGQLPPFRQGDAVAGRADLTGFGNERENAYIVYKPRAGLVVTWAAVFNEKQTEVETLRGLHCRLPFTVYVRTTEYKIALSGVHAPWDQGDPGGANLVTFLTQWGNLIGTHIEDKPMAHLVMGDFNTERDTWNPMARVTDSRIKTTFNENCWPVSAFDAAWCWMPQGQSRNVTMFSGRAMAPDFSRIDPGWNYASDMRYHSPATDFRNLSDHAPVYLEVVT